MMMMIPMIVLLHLHANVNPILALVILVDKYVRAQSLTPAHIWTNIIQFMDLLHTKMGVKL